MKILAQGKQDPAPGHLWSGQNTGPGTMELTGAIPQQGSEERGGVMVLRSWVTSTRIGIYPAAWYTERDKNISSKREVMNMF